MNVAYSAELEPEPIELDRRPCTFCGLTIDRHEMVDDGDGPLFYCADLSPDEMTLPELERRAELRREEEIAAILARMDAMDGPADIWSPREPEPQRYRTPQATINAFFYLVQLGDADRLRQWIDQHPLDAPELYRLWEDKNARA